MASKRKAKRRSSPKQTAPAPETGYKVEWKFPFSDGNALVMASDPPQKSGELDLICDTIVKHRMHAENIKERLAELVARLFGEGQASASDGNSSPAGSMLARIRDEASELGTVLSGASDILDKLETL